MLTRMEAEAILPFARARTRFQDVALDVFPIKEGDRCDINPTKVNSVVRDGVKFWWHESLDFSYWYPICRVNPCSKPCAKKKVA